MANFWIVALFNRLLPGILYFSYIVLWFNAVMKRLPEGIAWISHTLSTSDLANFGLRLSALLTLPVSFPFVLRQHAHHQICILSLSK